MKIIKANQSHFKDIIEIYNWAIKETTSTFDTELKSLETYGTFLSSFQKHPLLVAIEDEIVLGWGCLKPYSDRSAYDDTVELSVYISPNHHGKGIGNQMMQELLSQAKKYRFHSILSRITSESNASVKLHKKFGFEEVGVMKEVGLKFGRRIDVILMQKIIN